MGAAKKRRREENVKAVTLRAELEDARAASLAACARYRLLLTDPAASLLQTAAVAERAAILAGRVAGLARLLDAALR